MSYRHQKVHPSLLLIWKLVVCRLGEDLVQHDQEMEIDLKVNILVVHQTN
jgi:hypothetical protein